jgi:glycosyltransferase involved in cell wall biosynthesis
MRYSCGYVAKRSIRVVAIMEADFVTGPAKNLIEFARRARPRAEVSVVAYQRGNQGETEFIKAARAAGLTVDVVHERGRFDRSVTAKLRQIAALRDPDIIQTHNTKSHFFLRLSGIWRERTWLAFHHGYTSPDLKMILYHQADRWSLRAARHVVTVCGPFVDQLERRGIRRELVTVQHNSVKAPPPVSDSEIWRARERLTAPEGTPILVSIGRLSREKGHLCLVKAAAIVRDAGAPFHLVIVGEGPERAGIEKLVRILNLEEHITLAGLQNDVRPYYAMADVVVLPSYSEGSPNVLLEAMIQGRAVVATRVGGVPEIAGEETSLLVPSGSPEALAAGIERVLKDNALRVRMAAAGRSTAERFSPEHYCRSMIGLYERLVGAGFKA